MMVTIAIPAYKSKYLNEAIKSVLSQTVQDFELIIVNDSSPDDIKTVVSNFDDTRIRYYENEVNYGKESVVRNWNKCLELAKGEYFVLFSDDDVYENNFIEEMLNLSQKYTETNIFHCRVAIIDEFSRVINYTSTCPEYETVFEFIWHRIFARRLQFAPDFFVRTKALRNIGGFIDFPQAWCSDDATWFQLSADGGIAYSSKPLLKWRKSRESISNSGDVATRLSSLCSYEKWLNNFLDKLNAKSNIETFILKSIKNNLNAYISSLKKNLLVNKYNNDAFGILKIIFKWLRYRKKYFIDVKLLFSIITRLMLNKIKKVLNS